MSRTIGNPHGWPDYTWPMVWVLQDAELWPIEQWVAHQGQEKLWFVEVGVAGGASQVVNVYTVPAGKKLYVTRCWCSQEQLTHFVFGYDSPMTYWFRGTVGQYVPLLLPFAPPATLAAGHILAIGFLNLGVPAMTARATITAFELDV